MAYSFTQIEKEKSRTITAAFFFLVFVYFAGIWVIALLIRNFWFFQSQFDSRYAVFENQSFVGLGWVNSFYIAFWSFVVAGVHWFFASSGLVERLNGVFNAKPPDSNDPDEKMFQNIVEEVSVATGGVPIRPMIIPSMMLNACAYADGNSVPVIAVTKGLLSKLNRNQLEAVVGHEAAHVVSEDCQSTTIISAMFEIFGAALMAGQTIAEGAFGANKREDRSWGVSGNFPSGGGRGSGQGAFFIVFVVIIIFIIWLVKSLALLMRMFISRQREYRADATAVRLTRNPQALAEALYIIGHRRHSLYEGEDSLQSLFIINPAESILNDREGVVADLFSTHPPLQERIKILLSMANSSQEVLENTLKNVTDKEEQQLQERQKVFGQAKGGLWYVQTPGNNWSGPHNISAMLAFEWLVPQTRVRKMGENTVMPVSSIENYMKAHKETLKSHPALTCPSCSGTMAEILYEGIKILECQQCHGVLVNEEKISMILARKDKTFDSRIKQMARTLLEEKQLSIKDSSLSFESQRMYRCDQCKNNPHKMRRRIFNRYFPVEIDKCQQCGLTWFDKDELEVMQCLYEMRNAQL